MKIRALIFMCFISFNIYAQSGFTRINSIPVTGDSLLQFPWAGGLNFPVFSEIDVNNDGRKDLFAFDRNNNRVSIFLNNGNNGTACWQYAPEYESHFPVMNGWAFLFDYNCDGKPDIMCVNYRNNGITQYRNDSQGGNVIFTLVDSTMQFDGFNSLINIFASSNLVACFDDVDGDGDMDVLGLQFQCAGSFAYYQNMSMEDFGVCDSLNDYKLVSNAWGYFALRPGAYNHVALGSYNINCALESDADYEQSYVARRDDTYANIFTIDIDGDGDKDALIGDSQAINSLLVINGGTPDSARMVSQDTIFPSYNVPVNIKSFASHAYVDADNDGIKDLLVSQSEYENKNGIYFYKNNGTNSVPVFSFTRKDFLQDQMIDVGESATPVMFDADGDGLLDLIIGNKLKTITDTTSVTGLALYKNVGTATAPAFQFVTDNYAGIQSLNIPGQIYPAFGDLDGDGDKDMLLGKDDGQLLYFINSGVPASFTLSASHYMGIDDGQSSTPQIVDLNRDGKMDIITGDKNGFVRFYENTGTVANAFFNSVTTKDTLGGINVQNDLSPDGYSVPYLFDQNGDYRLLVTSMKGDIYLFGNIDGNLTGNFTVLDTIIKKTSGTRYGNNLSVSGGDLNGDGLTDITIGLYGGGLQIYYQDNLNAVHEINFSENSVLIYPQPASEKLIIKSGLILNAECRLFDIAGRLISSSPMNGGYSLFDVSGISQGVYLLQLKSGENVITKKVVINH